MSDWTGAEIAVIGMAGRFPGAKTPELLWKNLAAGVEAIRDLSEAELRSARESEVRMRDPNYVRRAAIFDDLEGFDAELFGFSPREASIMDPQHRHFLEVSWEALEDAALDPDRFEGRVGIFGGCGVQSYFAEHILRRPDLLEEVGYFLLRHTGNDKDFLVTRVAYLLGLTGPAVSVQTACSTSLVAVHQASQCLLAQECDAALAGGVTFELPHGRGYLPRAGEILAPDGHCRAFDHRAAGTVFGSGVGLVVLRRLEDALADGDRIHAVIRASAVNNDGGRKVGYLAPSVDGQLEAMVEAHALAGVPVRSIELVECHGTGTAMGDPIELAALTQAFRQQTSDVGFARIGSVKTNIGHLDTAAGVASLIKAIQALRFEAIPPSLNFERPNPDLRLESSPFEVATELRPWLRGPTPRRASVNSLGVGGTNAYLVLEEAPAIDAPSAPVEEGPRALALSAHSRAALDELSDRMADALDAEPSLTDVAFTLRRGRRRLGHRRVWVARSSSEAAGALRRRDGRLVFDQQPLTGAKIALLLPGGGAQSPGMGRCLIDRDPVFTDWMRRADAHLRSAHDLPLLDCLDGRPLEHMRVQLPAIMAVSVALAHSWMKAGLQPLALLGHSLGENSAAVLAEVFEFEAGLSLAFERGRLFDGLPPSGMLSVGSSAEALQPMLPPDVELAVVNAPDLCLVSGLRSSLEALLPRLEASGLEVRPVDVPVAAHSRWLEPILEPFGRVLGRMRLSPPRIPIVSNTTGDWLSPEDARSIDYWVRHLRQPVLFSAGARRLIDEGIDVFIESGPGRALSSMVRRHSNHRLAVPSLPHPEEGTPDDIGFMAAKARAWAADLGVGLPGEGASGRIVDLPTYAFQHKRHWVEPRALPSTLELERRPQDDWTETIHWREEPLGDARPAARGVSLLFEDDEEAGQALFRELCVQGYEPIRVRLGDSFARLGDREFVVSVERAAEEMPALLRALVADGTPPERILYAWLLSREDAARPGSSALHRSLEVGFYGLFHLVRALADDAIGKPLHVTALTNGTLARENEALPFPEKAVALGPVRVASNEIEGLDLRLVDIELPTRASGLLRKKDEAPPPWADAVREFEQPAPATPDRTVLLRQGRRFVPVRLRRAVHLDLDSSARPSIRAGETYLVTGGLGGIGAALVEQLVERHRAKALVVTRRPVPPREAWSDDPTLARFHRLDPEGQAIEVHAADVTDIEAMREATLGRTLRGAFHAAGTTQDALILAKTPTQCEDVFAPKLFGTLVLERVLKDQPLDFMVLFSSVSTWLAAPGQVDYVAANAFLDAFAQSRGGGVRSVQWGTWSEVGLAARSLGVEQEGTGRPVEHPFFESIASAARGERRLKARWSPREHWFLDEHRTAEGRAVVPGTAYVEAFLGALRAVEPHAHIELRNLSMSRPLFVEDETTCSVSVALSPSHEGFEVELSSRRRSGNAPGWVLHASAQARLGRAEAPPRLDLIAERRKLRPQAGVPGQALMRFGPRWIRPTEVMAAAGERGARLRLPQAEGDGCLAHPALVDVGVGLGIGLAPSAGKGLWVPVRAQRIATWGPLGVDVWMRARLRKAEVDLLRLDLDFADPEGQLLLSLAGLELRRLAEGLSPEEQPLRAGEWRAERASDARAPAASALAEAYRLGIRPSEGPAHLFGLLGADIGPVVTVSAVDVDHQRRLTAQAAASAQSRVDRFERPAMDVEYVEPRDGLEKTLASFWQDLLGVERVGARDDFFALGGHSLLAVRLFAKVRSSFGVELAISSLIEAPTVERTAALLRAHSQGAEERRATLDRPRFVHLVPMHPETPGADTPLHLVAGMFGNILNLRHLAHHIGTERPIYGLQARGLLGEHTPHEDFGAMARDYLAEIRQVQPSGPYFLGGFSGGGITAWEMARQLEASGERVALVIMIDTPIPEPPGLSPVDRVEIQLRRLRQKGPEYVAEWAINRWRWEMQRRREARTPDPSDGPLGQYRDRSIELAFRRALARYELSPLEVPVLLFRPPLDPALKLRGGRMVTEDRTLLFEDNGWSPYARRLRVEEVPGDHDSMVLEPNVRVLAQRIEKALRAAERETLPLAPASTS